MTKNNPSIKDVAQLAHVSIATVSRVLNNHDGFSNDTEKIVRQAIAQLHYQPNKLAQALKANTSNLVAVSVPTIWHPFFSEFLYYVELQLSKNGYTMLVSSNESDSKRELDILKMAQENKVAGIIAISYNQIEPYLTTNMPFVSIDRYFDSSNLKNVATVTSDNYAGGCLALKELIKRGTKKVAFVGSYAKYPNSAMLRKKGFVETAKKLNISYKIYEAPEKTLAEQMLFDHFLEDVEEFDGIFIVNDASVMEFLKKIDQRSIKIPEDLQIIGFDGFNYMHNMPANISSIVQSAPIMAQKAVEALLAIIKHQLINHQIIIPISFRAGNTTKQVIKNHLWI